MSRSFVLVVAAALAASSTHAQRPAPVRTDVADGIYLFATAPYGDVGLDGNSVVIVSSDGVLVFDSNGTPAAAEAVIAEIRKLTSQPVRYLVNSHWHWDHWYGAEAYRKAYPGVTIITHEASRRMMAGPAIEFNRPGLDTQLPGHIEQVEAAVGKARAANPKPANLDRLEAHLANDRFFLEQKRGVSHTLADLTFTDSLVIHLGGREIRVQNRGPAVTPGDAFLYLPKERIVVTGDLLINPISFALSAYPSGWLATLESIDGLDPAILVPGHGQPLRDEALLQAHIALFRKLLAHGKSAKGRGLDLAAAKAEILPALAELRATITGGDQAQDQAFDLYLVEWYLSRVYQELDGPLGDAIRI